MKTVRLLTIEEAPFLGDAAEQWLGLWDVKTRLDRYERATTTSVAPLRAVAGSANRKPPLSIDTLRSQGLAP